MPEPHRLAGLAQPLREGAGDRHGAVLPSGTADRDREVALALGAEAGKEETEQIGGPIEEGAGVRLPNPFFVPELRPFPGTDPRVSGFVLGQADARAFLDRAADLFGFLLPRFRAEGKSYLTIAIGCTGGKHRSVAIAGALAERLGQAGQPVRLWHRDVEKE